MRYRSLVAGLLLATSAAQAQDKPAERDYCPARPGLGTPACTIAPGRISVETGLADWTREQDSSQRTDTVVIGDTLVRIGLTDAVEAQIGWTPYGHVRTRGSGGVASAGGIGDVLVGFKANLHHPDGSGFSTALQPFVTLPAGGSAIGAGDWGAGIVAPFSFDLSDSLSFQFSPEIDAAVDGDRHGRHLAYSNVVGLGASLSGSVSGTLEFQALRDDDPAGATTQTYASLSFGWTPNDDLQLDVGAVAGLNANSADAEIYAGVSRRF
ncbi:transporter [soil metagenome]